MSFSISDIMKSISKNEEMPVPSGQLKNPDLPVMSNTFDDKIEIRDKAMSAFKLSSQPRNGNYFMLPRTRFDDDPRQDAFLMDGSIDPNVIRKRVNPDKAIPTIEGGEYALYSLVRENNESTDSVGLVRKAHASYVNYKNRFFVEDKSVKQPTELPIEVKLPNKPAIPTIITTYKQPEPLTKPYIYKQSYEDRNKLHQVISPITQTTPSGGIIIPEPPHSNRIPDLPKYGGGGSY